MHKICAQNAPCVWVLNTSCFFMLMQCEGGNCARIWSSYTTSPGPFQNDLALTCLFVSHEGQSSTTWEFLRFLLSFLFRSNLSLASAPWWKHSGPPPLSHSLLFYPAWSALQAGIHTAQWLGCHHSPLSRWSTVERGWAHLHRWVCVHQKNMNLCFFLVPSWPRIQATANVHLEECRSASCCYFLKLSIVCVIKQRQQVPPSCVHAFRSQITCSFITIYLFSHYVKHSEREKFRN